MAGVADDLRSLIEPSGRSWRYRDAWAALGRKRGKPVTPAEFEAAIATLTKAGVARLKESGAEPRIVIVGGSAPPVEEDDQSEQTENLPSGLISEADLMPYVETWLRDDFLKSFQRTSPQDIILQDTHRRGRVSSGVWSRPDFTIARVMKYRLSSSSHVRLYGFELKRADRGKIVSVHEALAHTRFVHFSYLIWHLPNDSEFRAGFDDIRSHCALHGIGLITFSEPASFSSYVTELDAERKSPDPAIVDEYVQERFDPEHYESLQQSVRA